MPSGEAPQNQQPIIDSVPGFSTEKPDIPVARHGQVVSIPESEFKGDPSKVLGHPSNPMTNMDTSALFPSTVKQNPHVSEAGTSSQSLDSHTGTQE